MFLKNVRVYRMFEDERKYVIVDKVKNFACWVEFESAEPDIRVSDSYIKADALSGYVMSRNVEMDFLDRMERVFDLDEVAFRLSTFHPLFYDHLVRHFIGAMIELDLFEEDCRHLNNYWQEFYLHPNKYRNSQLPMLVREWLISYKY